jgi:SP family galactose:H+ symporter-like MFS transporter
VSGALFCAAATGGSPSNQAAKLIAPAVSTGTGLLLEPALTLPEFTREKFAAAMATVGVLFNSGIEQHPSLGYPAIGALLVFIIGFAMSAGPIIWVICSEIYPLSGRDLGVSVSTATNWIVNAIVGQTFLTLINSIGGGNTFLLYGGLNVLFIIFFILLVPETKGISLEAIERNLMSGKRLREIGR